jgi:hypothetical protein
LADPAADPERPVGNPGRTRLWRRTASTAAIVAVLVVGNGTQAQAAVRPGGRTATVANSANAGQDAGSALHGQFRVLNRDGSAQLRQWQSGEVDAIDNLMLTVRSADGFNGRYLLGPGVSVTGIGVGDEVTVVGAGQAVPREA